MHLSILHLLPARLHLLINIWGLYNLGLWTSVDESCVETYVVTSLRYIPSNEILINKLDKRLPSCSPKWLSFHTPPAIHVLASPSGRVFSIPPLCCVVENVCAYFYLPSLTNDAEHLPMRLSQLLHSVYQNLWFVFLLRLLTLMRIFVLFYH